MTTPELSMKSTLGQSSSLGIIPESRYTSEEWKLEGVCRTVDPDLWYPENSSPAWEAKRLCRNCPVVTQCLEYALDNKEMFGIWGGLSPRERQRIRRDMGTVRPYNHRNSG